MKFSLVICTYLRPKPLVELLKSVVRQTIYPDEILIIDGSRNEETEKQLEKNSFDRLHYYKVSEEHRGLTKQRNYGIARVGHEIEFICFLDDDTVLYKCYFEQLLKTYQIYPEALGVGGYISNEIKWDFVGNHYEAPLNEFYFDGWKRKDGSRFVLRKKVGLDSDCPPGYSSLFSHGRSVGFLPPSGEIYEVEMLMGGVASYRKKVFETMQFSTYFEGYGLYEDADFSLRVAKNGKLFINTSAQLNHYHDSSGRPNQYRYGKMVVRNGWYVWRTKNPHPKIKDQLKWHSITILLTFIRFSNTFTSTKNEEAFTEALGRTVGWFGLWFQKPR
jgi:GT2 family glycosyltransferase